MDSIASQSKFDLVPSTSVDASINNKVIFSNQLTILTLIFQIEFVHHCPLPFPIVENIMAS